MLLENAQLELQIEAMKIQLRELTELVRQDRAVSPIIPLEVAAEDFFQRPRKTVLKWAKQGYLRLYAAPDGRRGNYYYFLREQLIEDIELNFAA